MQAAATGPVRAALIWSAVAAAVAIPIAAAASSPLLAYRQPIYIVGGFAGIAAMALLLLQPLLISGFLPGLAGSRGRRWHPRIGAALVLAVVIHVAGLWVTSPPDVIDALTFTAPTAFSAWGVVAMWAVFAAASLAALRKRLRLRPQVWRRVHVALVAIAVAGGVVHAVLIEGTMETISKVALCGLVVAATAKALAGLRAKRRVTAPPARD